jgi:hypothetical protein
MIKDLKPKNQKSEVEPTPDSELRTLDCGLILLDDDRAGEQVVRGAFFGIEKDR